ncbi:MAG: hypothetical protein U0893_23540 [Chloroflexota bacterium]
MASAESTWLSNIEGARSTVRESRGGQLAVIVTGSANDAAYWREHASAVAGDVFRADGATQVHAVHERTPKGNLLGTLNAWQETKAEAAAGRLSLPHVSLLSMVFGKGKRLSPFTQALGNCKAAIPTPYISPTTGESLRGGDLSSLYARSWMDTIERAGFRGVVVKWGDEAMIPGVRWDLPPDAFADVDAIRFVWQTEPDEILAREKEWVVVDRESGLMVTQYPRENLAAIQARRQQLGSGGRSLAMGVNLGSFAISYTLLDAALAVFGEDVADPSRAVDWDPYGWLAFNCATDAEWQDELAHEAAAGRSGLATFCQRYPTFFEKMRAVRARVEQAVGRQPRVAVLDFGECFWVDMGLHSRLRESLEQLTRRDALGEVTRALFGITQAPDERGNVVVESSVPAGADVRGSVIVRTEIVDAGSVVHDGVVVGGRHGRVTMPEGGVALFCALDDLSFTGPSAVALRSVGDALTLPAGGRHTVLYAPDREVPLVGSESTASYDGPSYDEPLDGNSISYGEAAAMMDGVGAAEADRRWRARWGAWRAAGS